MNQSKTQQISCEVARDLLPLYHDDVCSPESRTLVEAHLRSCEPCQSELKRIDSTVLDQRLQGERDDVMGSYAQKVRRRTVTVGISFAAVLAVPILVSLIVNLATGRSLDWFFIVLTALLVVASVVVVPLVMSRQKGLWTLGSFTVSLILLLLSCAIYTAGDWFLVTVVPILFGLSVIFAPLVLRALPLKGFAARHKGLIAMVLDTLLLLAVIVVSGIYVGAGSDYWSVALSSTLVGIVLPWMLFGIIRYLPFDGFIRAGLCAIVTGGFLSVLETIIEFIMGNGLHFSLLDANLLVWGSATTDSNVYLLMLIVGLVLGAIFIAVGLLRKRGRGQEGN